MPGPGRLLPRSSTVAAFTMSAFHISDLMPTPDDLETPVALISPPILFTIDEMKRDEIESGIDIGLKRQSSPEKKATPSVPSETVSGDKEIILKSLNKLNTPSSHLKGVLSPEKSVSPNKTPSSESVFSVAQIPIPEPITIPKEPLVQKKDLVSPSSPPKCSLSPKTSTTPNKTPSGKSAFSFPEMPVPEPTPLPKQPSTPKSDLVTPKSALKCSSNPKTSNTQNKIPTGESAYSLAKMPVSESTTLPKHSSTPKSELLIPKLPLKCSLSPKKSITQNKTTSGESTLSLNKMPASKSTPLLKPPLTPKSGMLIPKSPPKSSSNPKTSIKQKKTPSGENVFSLSNMPVSVPTPLQKQQSAPKLHLVCSPSPLKCSSSQKRSILQNKTPPGGNVLSILQMAVSEPKPKPKQHSILRLNILPETSVASPMEATASAQTPAAADSATPTPQPPAFPPPACPPPPYCLIPKSIDPPTNCLTPKLKRTSQFCPPPQNCPPRQCYPPPACLPPPPCFQVEYYPPPASCSFSAGCRSACLPPPPCPPPPCPPLACCSPLCLPCPPPARRVITPKLQPRRCRPCRPPVSPCFSSVCFPTPRCFTPASFYPKCRPPPPPCRFPPPKFLPPPSLGCSSPACWPQQRPPLCPPPPCQPAMCPQPMCPQPMCPQHICS